MDLRKKALKKRKLRHFVGVLTMALLAFLTDHPGMSSSSPFEATVEAKKIKKKNYRLPSSASPQVVKLDCGAQQSTVDISTHLETIRLELANCSEEIAVKNVNHNVSLHTFPTPHGNMTSEFAYLQKGKNQFKLLNGHRELVVNVLRFR